MMAQRAPGLLQRRLILIGPAGVGKSYTGNLLVGSDPRCREPFRVSGAAEPCTTCIRAVHSSAHNWTVVDTPGLGNAPATNDEAASAFDEEGGVGQFQALLQGVRNSGGMVLFFWRVERHNDTLMEHKLNQLRALTALVAPSSIVLVLVGIPPGLLLFDDTPKEERRQVMEQYFDRCEVSGCAFQNFQAAITDL
jgi:AIG1 family